MKKNTLKPTKTSTTKYFHKLLLLLSIITASCTTNDELVIDLDLNEFPDDTLVLKDVQVQTIREDSQRTDNLNFHVLGSINDSVFGQSDAAIYTQLGLGGTIDIPLNAELDSIILRLSFVDYYGNSDDLHAFDVYTLNKKVDQSRAYYNTSSTELGTKIGSVENYNVLESSGALKVDISKLWKLNAIGPGKAFSKDSAFQEELYGIAIVPKSDFGENEGTYYYFNLISANSYVNAYYHYYNRVNNILERADGTSEFQFRTNVKSYSSFSHNYTNEIVSEGLDKDSTSAYRSYVQALGGTYTKILIPELEELARNELLAFHKVELVLPCETSYHSPSIEPIPFLDIKYTNSNGDLVDLPDRAKVYWVRAFKPAERAYIFNITSHIQGVVNNFRFQDEFSDDGLVIKAIKNEPIPFSAGRYVLKGSSAKRDDGAYLRIFYSEIDQP
ncbi:MAG: DUF4270 family protein [Bacteroidia bacterium]